jgi:hypothetical protein
LIQAQSAFLINGADDEFGVREKPIGKPDICMTSIPIVMKANLNNINPDRTNEAVAFQGRVDILLEKWPS